MRVGELEQVTIGHLLVEVSDFSWLAERRPEAETA